MRRVAASLLLLGGLLIGQPPKDAFFQQREKLQAQAKAAFDREMSREKAGDCQNTNTTYDIVTCLAKEVSTTDGNYQAYAGAIRAMLAQKNPYDNGTDPAAGPTGKPATQQENLRRFDEMQSAWERYRNALYSGVDGLYRGGTIVNIEVSTCHLMMMRSHLRELAATYGEYLSH
jgi:uncharacterized protein YecT (DUF1311 family)